MKNLILLCVSICISAATLRADEPSAAIPPPESLEQALKHLEKLFGELQESPQLTRFVYDQEIETTPETGGPKVFVVLDGLEHLTNPVIHGDSIILHRNAVFTQKVFKENDEGKRTLIRQSDRTHAMQIRITQFPESIWIVETSLQNHPRPRYVAAGTSTGRVKWFDDGVEFHTTGFDCAYVASGDLKPVSVVTIERFERTEGRLHNRRDSQSYEPVTTPEGAELLVPDFSKPSGERVSWELVSQVNIKRRRPQLR